MSGMKFALLGSTALRSRVGRMTPAERSKGRYMRAPDGHGDAEFDAFEASGTVEVGKPAGDGIETNQPEPEAEKPAKKSGRGPREKAPAAGAEKPAAKAAEKAAGKDKPGAQVPADGEADEGDEGDEGEGDEEGDEDEQQPKPKRKPSERISELSARLRQSERLRLADASRLEAAVRNGGLPAGKTGGKSAPIGEAPISTMRRNTPSGTSTTDISRISLNGSPKPRQPGKPMRSCNVSRKASNSAKPNRPTLHCSKRSMIFPRAAPKLDDDFQEAVVDAGMRGDWRLDQPTFEAAHEAENGAQILYELSQDKKEAKRVAALTPYQQLKFVLDCDAEIGKGKQPRRIPGAGAPPATQTRGANSSTRINPATSNLDDFEKAWAADEKGGK